MLGHGSRIAITPYPVKRYSRRSTLPYGIAIAFGAIWAGWLPRLLFA